jgi:hypothetical protein
MIPGIFRRLLQRAKQSKAEIVIDGEYFGIMEPQRPAAYIRFADIAQITGFKLSQVTVDLICFEIVVGQSDRKERVYVLHEDLPGFEELTARLAMLPGFNRDWHSVVAYPPFKENGTVLFQRSPAEHS